MIIPLMAAEMYGVAIMGRVMGIVLTADSVAESVVPMVVAGLRDSTGSYGPGSWCSSALAARRRHRREPAAVDGPSVEVRGSGDVPSLSGAAVAREPGQAM